MAIVLMLLIFDQFFIWINVFALFLAYQRPAGGSYSFCVDAQSHRQFKI